jgi:hypothetical protein
LAAPEPLAEPAPNLGRHTAVIIRERLGGYYDDIVRARAGENEPQMNGYPALAIVGLQY